MDSDYPFGIFWPLHCLFFFDWRILITSFWYLLAIVLSVLLWLMDSDYPFGIFWPLYCLFFFDWRILITSLWYLLAIALSVLLWLMDSDYPFGIFWPLYCLFFFDWWILITSLVSSNFSLTGWVEKKNGTDEEKYNRREWSCGGREEEKCWIVKYDISRGYSLKTVER